MKKLQKIIAVLLIFACLAGTSSTALAATHTESGTCAATLCLKGKSKTKYVWITPESGKKYHKKSCRTIKIRYKVKMKLSEAKKKGYTRCKVCKP